MKEFETTLNKTCEFIEELFTVFTPRPVPTPKSFLFIASNFCYKNFFKTYPYLAVSGFIIASCIRRRVTSNGYENDCASAPAKPPQRSFAGTESTRPP